MHQLTDDAQHAKAREAGRIWLLQLAQSFIPPAKLVRTLLKPTGAGVLLEMVDGSRLHIWTHSEGSQWNAARDRRQTGGFTSMHVPIAALKIVKWCW